MRTYYIYKATSKTTGKSYVGQTCRYKERLYQHRKCDPREDSYFHREIKKLGFDDFEWEVIDKAYSKDKSLELEEHYIAYYNTQYPNGYNITAGGKTTPWDWSIPVVCLTMDGEYVKEYKSAAEAERLDGFVNTTVLECCKGKAYTCKGHQFMFKDDYEAYGGKKCVKPDVWNMTPVIQCDMNGNLVAKYKSVQEASRITGVRRSTISGVITGTYKTAGGFIWVYEKDFPIKDLSKHVKKKKGRKVAQIDKETGEVIKVFDRMADAGRELGVNYKGIHKVIDKPDKSAYGYRWKSIC